ncbi:MAG: oxygen-independent coproporphyrinogen III oxidase [Proteobacteria bacterium]|nr:oxygen-independent coproporphyrinogen III oxidase [Pseudomonadota bacterium]
MSSKTLKVDVDILKKYSKAGPRYTSYPTAPVFTEDFTDKDYGRIIKETNEAESPSDISLYFHLPFCRSVCYFCGCNVVYTKRGDQADQYLDYLEKEIELIAGMQTPGREVVQLHFGGGTPTFLSTDQLRRLGKAIKKNFTLADNVEAGVEIDPREASDEHIKTLREIGFNRISMGIQDFDPTVQKAVHRVQTEELSRHVIDVCREEKFDSINVDLIFGLPHQTVESFEKTVDKIIEINPDRMAVFNFAYVPWMKPIQKSIKEEDLPSAEEKFKILKMVIEKFTTAGYVYVGMDHFAKPDDELFVAQKNKTLYRNFQGYTTHAGCDLYGLGATSISQVGNCYVQNKHELPDYYQMIEEGRIPTWRGYELNNEDILRRHIITRIMCDFELTFSDVEKEFDLDFKKVFALELSELEPMTKDDLLTISDEGLVVSDLGRILIRNIAMVFDTYLRKPEKEMRFSKTI